MGSVVGWDLDRARLAVRFARFGWAALTITGCSSTSYVHLAPVEPPAQSVPDLWKAVAQPLGDKGRVVLDVAQGHASVVEDRQDAEQRLVCSVTPCVDDVGPGAHRYRFIPLSESSLSVEDGFVVSKDGVYGGPIEANAAVTVGKTEVLRASLGRTEVHRSLPAGRVIGWALFGSGIAIAMLGIANGASAPSGSGAEEVGHGVAEIGLGTVLFGGALLLWNLRDNVTVSEHPGAVRQWSAQ